jgi:outer membrane protein TolC
MIKKLLLLGCAAALWIHAADVLTLDHAVQLAMAHNRTLRDAEIDVVKAQAQVMVQRTRLYPSLQVQVLGSQLLTPIDFTLQRGILGTYPNVGPIPAENIPIDTPLRPTGIFTGSIGQPLLTLYRIHQSLKVLDFSTDLAKEQVRATRQDVAHDVKSLYYSIQQAQAALAALEDTVKLYREVVSLTTRYLAEQTVLKGDLLQARTQLARAEQSQAVLLDQEDSAKEALNRLLGRDVLTAFDATPPEEATGLESDIDSARRRALEQRSELRQARIKLQQAEQDRRAKKAEYIPDVNASFNSIDVAGFNSFIPLHFTSLGISITWEPFDWGRKKHELAIKDSAIEQVRNASADAESQIVIDVDSKFRKLRQSRTQLTVDRLAQETAAENLRVVREKFQQQASLVKDVLQAQAALEQTNSDYRRSLSAFWTAKADFEKALGEDR